MAHGAFGFVGTNRHNPALFEGRVCYASCIVTHIVPSEVPSSVCSIVLVGLSTVTIFPSSAGSPQCRMILSALEARCFNHSKSSTGLVSVPSLPSTVGPYLNTRGHDHFEGDFIFPSTDHDLIIGGVEALVE